ncbi:MAG: site-specific DNA-methyltransferase [Lachnospiraceae bacterium]|nr:site-specific DNA-methyltransferase [Lachnospiraceae bacterium]
MELVKRKLKDLKPAEYNPRKALTPNDIEYQRIAASIEQFGYVDPIIINSDNTIIGGHQRRTVMLDLGYDEADVIVVDMDKTNEKALNIALNKITGEWDEQALRSLLIDLDNADFDVALTGYGDDELAELFRNTEIGSEVNEDKFDVKKAVQEAEASTITRQGDIWQLGNHRLLCGDASDFSDIELLMAGAKANIVITDPPYNVDYEAKDKSLERSYKQNRTRRTNEIIGDRMDDGDFYNFLYRIFTNFCDVAKEGAVIYVFHADIEGLTFRQAFTAAGFKLSEVLIWEKNQFVIGRQDYHWRHEPILYGWKEGAGHYWIGDRSQDNIFIEDDVDFFAMKKPELVAYIEKLRAELSARTSIQYEKKPARSELHPTMKPVALVGRLMSNSSRYKDNVADFFAGSGTTLIAAEQLQRTAYLMEINPVYCDVIVKRWEEYAGKKAVRVRGGEGSGR